MLATLSGTLALAIGLAVLLLPLMAMEMSRPRDSAWGAVVLLLGLVLVTSADRLAGAPMLAVVCSALLIGRLGTEVLQLRWRQLSPEEQRGLQSVEHWQTSGQQLVSSAAKLAGLLSGAVDLVGKLPRLSGSSKDHGKRWIRPEGTAAAQLNAAASEGGATAQGHGPDEPEAQDQADLPGPTGEVIGGDNTVELVITADASSEPMPEAQPGGDSPDAIPGEEPIWVDAEVVAEPPRASASSRTAPVAATAGVAAQVEALAEVDGVVVESFAAITDLLDQAAVGAAPAADADEAG